MLYILHFELMALKFHSDFTQITQHFTEFPFATQKKFTLHSFNFSYSFILIRVTVYPEPITRTLGVRQEYTLTSCHVILWLYAHSHILHLRATNPPTGITSELRGKVHHLYSEELSFRCTSLLLQVDIVCNVVDNTTTNCKIHTRPADNDIKTGLSSDLHVNFGGRRCICIFKDQTTPPFP